MEKRKYTNRYASVAQLVTAIVTFCFVYIQYVSNNDKDTNKMLLPIFFLFVGTVLIDRIGALVSAYSFDEERNERNETFAKIRTLLQESREIVTFPSREGGVEYYRYAINKKPIHVRNTVLRYGVMNSIVSGDSYYDALYAEWVALKKRLLRESPCEWEEIISAHLDTDDIQIKSAVQNSSINYRYKPRYIDDKAIPMAQLTIFEYENEDPVVLFGWEYPGLEFGPTFLSSNRALVGYFSTYFNYHFRQAAHGTREAALARQDALSGADTGPTHRVEVPRSGGSIPTGSFERLRGRLRRWRYPR